MEIDRNAQNKTESSKVDAVADQTGTSTCDTSSKMRLHHSHDVDLILSGQKSEPKAQIAPPKYFNSPEQQPLRPFGASPPPPFNLDSKVTNMPKVPPFKSFLAIGKVHTESSSAHTEREKTKTEPVDSDLRRIHSVQITGSNLAFAPHEDKRQEKSDKDEICTEDSPSNSKPTFHCKCCINYVQTLKRERGSSNKSA